MNDTLIKGTRVAVRDSEGMARNVIGQLGTVEQNLSHTALEYPIRVSLDSCPQLGSFDFAPDELEVIG